MFESHEADLMNGTSSDTSLVAQLHTDSSCDNSKHETNAPKSCHSCHLAHCGFTINAYYISITNTNIVSFFIYSRFVPLPFLDEEVRPPILA